MQGRGFRISPGEAFAVFVGACFVAILLTIVAMMFFPWSLPVVILGGTAEAYWVARWLNSRRSY